MKQEQQSLASGRQKAADSAAPQGKARQRLATQVAGQGRTSSRLDGPSSGVHKRKSTSIRWTVSEDCTDDRKVLDKRHSAFKKTYNRTTRVGSERSDPRLNGQRHSAALMLDQMADTRETQATSYWSFEEMSSFPQLLRSFGSNWQGIAKHMKTKTAVMVENYYMRKERENPTWSQIVAEARLKLSRGEKPPAPPAPTTESEDEGLVPISVIARRLMDNYSDPE